MSFRLLGVVLSNSSGLFLNFDMLMMSKPQARDKSNGETTQAMLLGTRFVSRIGDIGASSLMFRVDIKSSLGQSRLLISILDKLSVPFP